MSYQTVLEPDGREDWRRHLSLRQSGEGVTARLFSAKAQSRKGRGIALDDCVARFFRHAKHLFCLPPPRGESEDTMLLPTSLVGSYPQPEWLIDRAKLSKLVPRVRAEDLWLVRAGAARSGPGRCDHPRHPRPGARRARHRQRRRAAARKLFQPLRDGARGRRYRKSGHGHEPHRPADPGAANGRADPAARSGRSARLQGPARQHRAQDQGDRAWPIHHEPAGPGRLL